MPGKTSEALEALVTQSYPIPAEVWGDFWDRLADQELHPGEALAVVTSLTSHLPDGASVSTLLSSLRERNPQPDPPPRPDGQHRRHRRRAEHVQPLDRLGLRRPRRWARA